MKSVVILIIVLVAGGTWWFTGQNKQGDATEGDAATAPVEDAEGSDTVATDKVNEAAVSDASTAVSGTESDAAELDESVAATEETPGETSPFAVVETEAGQVTEEAAAVVQEVQPQALPDTTTEEAAAVNNEAASTQRSGERIVVPTSYPISDAAKYFVPKSERGPGNLGGPPPLDFPGGPNDPNAEPGTLFQPPPAPGQ